MAQSRIRRFTAKTLPGLKPERHAVDWFDELTKGLALRVTPAGARTWYLFYSRDGRPQRLKLGALKDIPLADARVLVHEHRRDLAKGIDPLEARRAEEARRSRERAETVEALVDRYVEKYAKKNKSSWQEDERMLRTFVIPAWKGRASVSITRGDVRDLIEEIAESTPVQANRVYEVIRKMLYWAVDQEILEKNVAARMPKPTKEYPRERVLPDDELRRFWEITDTMPLAMQAWWRMRLLTCQRSSEVAGMRWADVNLADKIWIIPSRQVGRKNRRQHVVPLSQPVLDILKALRADVEAYRDAHPYAKEPTFVCRGARGKRQQGEAAETFGLEDFRGHDLRRTATTNMRKARISRTDVTYVLGQTQREGSASLQHYDLWEGFPEKKRALNTWARILMRVVEQQEPAAKVVEMAGRR